MLGLTWTTRSWIPLLGSTIFPLLPGAAPAADCDGDKVDDAEEIASDPFGFASPYWCGLRPQTRSVDVGDVDGDHLVDVIGIEEGRLLVHPGRPNGGFGVPVEGAAIGPTPAYMEVNDFDGDGHGDVALVGYQEKEILVLRGTDAGRLDLAMRLPTPAWPRWLYSADVNGDGHPDLILDLDTAVLVLLFQRDGFEQVPAIPVGHVSSGIVVADLDRDGDVDLAFASSPQNEPRILRVLKNDGSGRAFDFEDSPLPFQEGYWLIPSDWDQDGDTDLLLFTDRSMQLVMNDGLGRFTAGKVQDLGSTELDDVDVGDLDGDGVDDLVTAEFDGTTISILRGLGGGALADKPVRIDADPPETLDVLGTLRALDVNQDGRLDIVRIGVFGGFDSDGRYAPHVGYFVNRGTADCNANGIPDVCEPDCNANGWPDDCDIAQAHEPDCNGNLVPDACEQLDYNHNDVSDACELLRGELSDCNANGLADLDDLAPRFVMGEGEKPPVLLSNAASPAIADVDGDGDLDLTLRGTTPPEGDEPYAEDTDVTWIGLNDGTGQFDFKEGPHIAGEFLGALDLDGDGLPDFVFQSEKMLTIAGNDGHGISDISTQVPFDESMVPYIDVQFSDLDGDEDIDLFSSTMTQVETLLNDGKGLFKERRKPSILRASGEAPVLGDFDGDGLVDLLSVGEIPGEAAEHSEPLLYLNKGQAGFAPGPMPQWKGPYLSKGYLAFTWYAKAPVALARDLDGDGLADLSAVAIECDFCDEASDYCRRPKSLWVILNQGNGVFSFKESHMLGTRGSVRAADLDLDGDTDLMVSQLVSYGMDGEIWAGRTAQAFLNRGDVRFEAQLEMFVGEMPSQFDLADLNGDAYPDLVVGARDPGELRILFNHTVPPKFHDLDHNDLLDECDVNFQRGDWNQDAHVDLSDAVAILSWLFLGAEGSLCEKSGDADDDGSVNLTDPIRILRRLFQGAEPLPEPREACGRDATPDQLPCTDFRPCR